MQYLGKILAFCVVVFGAFAIYKYAPDMVRGAQHLTASVYNLISAR